MRTTKKTEAIRSAPINEMCDTMLNSEYFRQFRRFLEACGYSCALLENGSIVVHFPQEAKERANNDEKRMEQERGSSERGEMQEHTANMPWLVRRNGWLRKQQERMRRGVETMVHRKTTGKHGRRRASSGKPPLPPPGRAADRPFCAYLGAAGETCTQTANLAEVLVIDGPPRLVWMACPLHREEVRQMATSFVLRSQATPLPVQFHYQGESYEVWVAHTRPTDRSSGA